MSPGFTVLVVDDEPMICRLAKAMLERVGVRAITVNSAAEALEEMKRGEFGLVITDIQMPQSSGLELCKALHDAYPTVPIVAMSGSGATADNENLRQARAAGAASTLLKPFDLADFYNAVNAAKWLGFSA